MKKMFLLFTLVLLAWGVQAQSPTGAAEAADKKAVEAAVKTLFEAMRRGDSSLARTVVTPNMRITILVTDPTGKVVLRESSAKKFLETIGTPRPKAMDERYWDARVEVDGDLASLWCQYAFFSGTVFSHCGVDVFQLYRSAQGWKIINLAYNMRKEKCDLAAIPKK